MTTIPEGMVACPFCTDGTKPNGFMCWNCFGRAYVVPGSPDEFCRHDYADVASGGRCITIYECLDCGYRISVDSS